MLIKANYFDWNCDNKFDAIITDPPYKEVFKNELFENELDYNEMFYKFDKDLKENAALILFSNFMQIPSLVSIATESFGFKLHTYQIWDKSPIRNWISWQLPLRTTEFILYFKKGNFRYSFKDGTEKPKYKRSSFGSEFIHQKENTNEVSYGIFEDIIRLSNIQKNKIHPTQKPIEFSEMFKKIVGDVKVLDPFCGSGNLIKSFSNAIGIDIKDYWIK
jgi:DNA modification methylase